MPKSTLDGLTTCQIQNFVDDGFVKLDHAFSPDLAQRCREELWADMGLSPDHPEGWTEPVVRVGFKSSPPFAEAGNSARLRKAFDQLAGEGRWVKPAGLGIFPVRFPSRHAPGDDGWHVDMSFGTDNPDFMEWRVNVKSRGRALLMLFLFSNVGSNDAPTRIRKGSHHAIARQLLPRGGTGMTLRQLAADGFASTKGCDLALATGEAGTVYLCHPFVVHAAQPHRGKEPRFMALPPLLPRGDFDPALPPSPVQIAIRKACNLSF